MSLLDKKLFLRDLGDRLAGLVTANTGTEIIEQVADILGSYNVEFVKPQEKSTKNMSGNTRSGCLGRKADGVC